MLNESSTSALTAVASIAMTHTSRTVQTITRLLVGLLLLFVVAGCQSDEGERPTVESTKQWFQEKVGEAEELRDAVRDVGEVLQAYQDDDLDRAVSKLDSLKGTINWEKLGSPEMRDRILTVGTEVYASLDRPEDAARLIENALPHLEGDLRAQWDEIRARLESGDIPTTLEQDGIQDPTTAE